ncbi:hypothetical protein [Rhodococcus sp. RD6.2]|uniref:Rv1733c family protein n=1 Tax=Rhodococcus sp. RD6.2 TaxID=260936 RepID=UPI0012ED337A|nr:hypothetical protein [Rhodococcus sp. RD6.2]
MSDSAFSAPGRWWRLRPWNTNTLMRPSDRLEGVLILVIAGVVALSIPVAGAVGTSTYSRLSDIADSQREQVHQVTAVLTDDAPQRLIGTTMSNQAFVEQAPAQWSVNGVAHAGPVPAEVGDKAGQTVSIWIDPAGAPTGAPRSSTENAAAALGVTVGAWALCSATCGLVILGLHWLTDRIRLRQWQREWERVDRSTGWSLS